MRLSRWMWAAFALMLVVAASAAGQDRKREAQLRTVRGTVLDRDENPLPGSIVFLKNTRTQIVKTYRADEDGNYRFSGLDPNVDYELHAEHDDQTSRTRTVSSFESRKELVLSLKVNQKRSKP